MIQNKSQYTALVAGLATLGDSLLHWHVIALVVALSKALSKAHSLYLPGACVCMLWLTVLPGSAGCSTVLEGSH